MLWEIRQTKICSLTQWAVYLKPNFRNAQLPLQEGYYVNEELWQVTWIQLLSCFVLLRAQFWKGRKEIYKVTISVNTTILL